MTALVFILLLVCFFGIALLGFAVKDLMGKKPETVKQKLDKIISLLENIYAKLSGKQKLKSARVAMAIKTVNVGETHTATLQCQDQNNQPITLDASYQVAWNASDPSTVSFGTPNPDGSVQYTALKGTSGVAIGAAITGGTVPSEQTVNAATETLVINSPAVLTSAQVVLP